MVQTLSGNHRAEEPLGGDGNVLNLDCGDGERHGW